MKFFFSKKMLYAGWISTLILPASVILSETIAWWWMNPSSSGESSELLYYRFPDERPGYTRKSFDPSIIKSLRCDAGQIGKIEMKGGEKIDVNYFEWNSTDEKGLMEAFGHAPDVCMGIAGYKVVEFLPNRVFQIGGQDLVFDVTTFRDGRGDPFYIFKAPWVEKMWGLNLLREGPLGEKSFRIFKLNAVRYRWKPRFSRVLMAGVTGLQSEQDSWNLLRETVLKDLEIKQTRMVRD